MKKRWIVLIVIIAVLAIIRIALPFWLENQATKKLSQIEGHTGVVKDVDLRLYRLTYIINSISITKTGDSIPEPFMEVEKLEITLQLGPLWREGKLFADINIINPELNFMVVERQDSGQVVKVKQFGQGVNWIQEFKKMNPLEMDNLDIENGKITYSDNTTNPQVDLKVDSLHIKATNLKGYPDSAGGPLLANFTVSGNALGKNNLTLEGQMNMQANPTDMDASFTLENVSLVQLNSLLRLHANTDVNSGRISVYSELVINEGQIDGYIKPVIENLDILNWETEDEPFFSKIGEAVKGLFSEVVENQEEEQIATSVPLSGKIDNMDTGIWPAIGNLLKNAFVEAFSKELNQTIEFQKK